MLPLSSQCTGDKHRIYSKKKVEANLFNDFIHWLKEEEHSFNIYSNQHLPSWPLKCTQSVSEEVLHGGIWCILPFLHNRTMDQHCSVVKLSSLLRGPQPCRPNQKDNSWDSFKKESYINMVTDCSSSHIWTIGAICSGTEQTINQPGKKKNCNRCETSSFTWG